MIFTFCLAVRSFKSNSSLPKSMSAEFAHSKKPAVKHEFCLINLTNLENIKAIGFQFRIRACTRFVSFQIACKQTSVGSLDKISVISQISRQYHDLNKHTNDRGNPGLHLPPNHNFGILLSFVIILPRY